MDERFLLDVIYKGEVLKYDAEFRNYGYIQKIAVDIDGLLVFFEPDEEGSFRALVNPEQLSDKNNTLEIGLLQVIAQRIEALHQ